MIYKVTLLRSCLWGPRRDENRKATKYFIDLGIAKKSLHNSTMGSTPSKQYPDARLEYELCKNDPNLIWVYENFHGFDITEENQILKHVYYQSFAVIEIINPLMEVTEFFDEKGYLK